LGLHLFLPPMIEGAAMSDVLISALMLGLMLAGFTLGYSTGFRNRQAAELSEPTSRAWVAGFRAGLDASWSDVQVVRHD
jgi:hypothetical protein